MTHKEAIKIFQEKKVRTIWDSEQEKWYFSIVDVISVLTDSADGRKYWNKLKQRLKEEGNETVTNCHQLKMRAADGKMRMTDVADTGQLFRLIQSIPSPKAEPFKLWMAQVVRERLDEMQDPELTIDRAMMEYLTDEPLTNREQNCVYTSFAEVRKRKAKPMEKERIERRHTICHPHRYYHSGMGWHDYKRIQGF